MKWVGIKIKELAKEKGHSFQYIASTIGVSRQTINDWIRGQIPKGNHLLVLCRLFQVDPGYFFEEDFDQFLRVPVHRTQRGVQITPEMQDVAKVLTNEYGRLFRNHKKPSVIPVIRTRGFDYESAIQIAGELRCISNISEEKPIDYQHTFLLAEKLGINVVFRYFPDTLKSYAFYTKISDNRVIFVNCFTNIIDLIFPLLHEFVHAIRDESEQEYNKTEEDFCDMVACKVQFPDEYVRMVYKQIEGLEVSLKINKLKEFAKINKHSIHGIFKAIKYIFPDFTLSYGGADTNLKKEFPTIGDIILRDDDPRGYALVIQNLSRNFLNVLISQLDSISDRKLAELLGFDNSLDSKEIRKELNRMKLSINN